MLVKFYEIFVCIEKSTYFVDLIRCFPKSWDQNSSLRYVLKDTKKEQTQERQKRVRVQAKSRVSEIDMSSLL